ncbi:nuclear transport factor 2 family protein [Pararoseomonas sp. SCSIO 73927]|uniref:nuclear transport factor 2 family protein n=1 Tax=Pararoseomonas sp. SCSIO 73927 TaxID=3114537 RepID=UPI0030D4A17D
MTEDETGARNVAMVQGVYERFARGDRQALYDALSPEVHWTSAGDETVPWAGTRHGHDGVRDYFARLDRESEAVGYEVEQVIAQGEWIAILARVRRRAHATGTIGDYAKADFMRIVDGRVVDFREFYDTGRVCRDFRLG